MKLHKLSEFTKGWIVGDFVPSIFRTKDFEVCVQRYTKGQKDEIHIHKHADEITIIIEGKFIFNGNEIGPDDVVVLEKGEISDCVCIESGSFVGIKIPSVIGDKHIIKKR